MRPRSMPFVKYPDQRLENCEPPEMLTIRPCEEDGAYICRMHGYTSDDVRDRAVFNMGGVVLYEDTPCGTMRFEIGGEW